MKTTTELIAEAQKNGEVIRGLVSVMSDHKSASDGEDYTSAISALNFANRLIYRHIDNLRHVEECLKNRGKAK